MMHGEWIRVVRGEREKMARSCGDQKTGASGGPNPSTRPEPDWVDELDDVREEEDEEQNDDGEGWLDDEDDEDEIEIVDPLDDWEE